MLFGQTFFSLMVLVALVGITAAAVTLIILLIKDIKSKKLW